MKLLALWLACAQPDTSLEPTPVEQVETREREATIGPVKTRVVLSPKQPKLGDPLTLTLEVQAAENVEVELPPFGEALGRFQIVSYEPVKEDEDYKQSQVYTLQAPMSGVQTIPSLRVVFFDRREGPDAEEQEILTEEISIDIESLLEEDAPLDFRNPRGRLEPKVELPIWAWTIGGGLLLSILGVFGWRWAKARRSLAVVRSAYQQAMESLLRLSQHTDKPIDEYYAELSLILRRYIDARFGIPVLEKTTPEFIMLANGSDVFQENQLIFLKDFLQRADDVKYAQQQPELQEGDTELLLIRRFLEETKPKEEEV